MQSLSELVGSLKDRPISVSLSGGGFRASLFSLGALLYLVDSAENRRVHSISSVSGGSVLNGLVAQAGDFSKMSVEDIDAVSVQLLKVVLGKGLIWSSRVASFAIAAIGLTFVWWLTEFLFGWPLGLNRWQLVLLLGLIASAALFRGLLVSWRMSKAFFRVAGPPTALEALTSDVTHVFCTTDLNSADPVFIEAGAGRRLVTPFGVGNTDKLPLEAAVRASAAFPGAFPPKRLRLSEVGLVWKQRTQRVHRTFNECHSPACDRVEGSATRWP